MVWNSGLTKLQGILSNLYPTAGRSRSIVAVAGLPDGRINFEQASLDRWHEILEEADRHGKVQSIVAVAQKEYPARKTELEAAQQEYLSVLGRDDQDAQPSPGLRQRFTGFGQKSELVTALLACPAIRDRNTRDTVVDNLSSDIRTSIPRSDIDRTDVMNIVTTVLNYENGLEELVEIVRVFEGNSVSRQDLDRLLA